MKEIHLQADFACLWIYPTDNIKERFSFYIPTWARDARNVHFAKIQSGAIHSRAIAKKKKKEEENQHR